MIKRFTYSVISTILFLLIVLLMVITVYGVVMRYFLRIPDVRIFFLSMWFWGSIFLLGFGHALYEKTHVFVDVFYSRLSQAMQKALRSFGLLISLLCIVIMLPNSMQLAWRSYLICERESTLPIFSPPIWWYKWFLISALTLAALQILSAISNEVRARRV
jgi:TRAP-type mannitol/chloroaromatic compound transport system permease small subunit